MRRPTTAGSSISTAIWSWPKPVQTPHPPILLGGNGPRALDRVLACADGWAPLPAPGLCARIEELRRRADRGRPCGHRHRLRRGPRRSGSSRRMPRRAWSAASSAFPRIGRRRRAHDRPSSLDHRRRLTAATAEACLQGVRAAPPARGRLRRKLDRHHVGRGVVRGQIAESGAISFTISRKRRSDQRPERVVDLHEDRTRVRPRPAQGAARPAGRGRAGAGIIQSLISDSRARNASAGESPARTARSGRVARGERAVRLADALQVERLQWRPASRRPGTSVARVTVAVRLTISAHRRPPRASGRTATPTARRRAGASRDCAMPLGRSGADCGCPREWKRQPSSIGHPTMATPLRTTTGDARALPAPPGSGSADP